MVVRSVRVAQGARAFQSISRHASVWRSSAACVGERVSGEASEVSRIDRHFDECWVALAGMVQHAAQLAFLHTCVAQYAENYGQMNIGVRRGTPHPPCVVHKVSKGIWVCASKRGWNRCVQRGEGGCSHPQPTRVGEITGFGWNCGHGSGGTRAVGGS